MHLTTGTATPNATGDNEEKSRALGLAQFALRKLWPSAAMLHSTTYNVDVAMNYRAGSSPKRQHTLIAPHNPHLLRRPGHYRAANTPAADQDANGHQTNDGKVGKNLARQDQIAVALVILLVPSVGKHDDPPHAQNQPTEDLRPQGIRQQLLVALLGKSHDAHRQQADKGHHHQVEVQGITLGLDVILLGLGSTFTPVRVQQIVHHKSDSGHEPHQNHGDDLLDG
mmetsp:Transcript_46145/g.98720  ORF Transcript_46145/g.98720 Transcript_46145/m.98720 type:complete len:225 (+) Transcript_46145:101-775(+)